MPARNPIRQRDLATDRQRGGAQARGADAAALAEVAAFWNAESCGEVYATGSSETETYESQSATRYQLEPYIRSFAKFEDGRGKQLLEIGVGMGADHAEWARVSPRGLVGIDLTPRAIDHTRRRLTLLGFPATLVVGNAEELPFNDEAFDLVYSWGVLHHTPDTQKAVGELHRVLRPGGIARVMIYHKHSVTSLMLWLRYGLLAGRPRQSLTEICARHLESPGTKVHSVREAERLFSAFSDSRIRPQLAFGDLLQGAVGQRHRGTALTFAKALWPRWLLKRVAGKLGLALLVEATK